MGSTGVDTEELLNRVGRGDGAARQQLLTRHRRRLRRMIAVRMDRRMAARIDPSDVVQETLAEADQKLFGYLRARPLPFYPWLRQLAIERLIDLHRRHIQARKRSVTRERRLEQDWSDESVMELARRLVSSGSSPSERMVREELHRRVQSALEELPPRDREILVMRHLEELRVSEIASVLGITEGAVKTRHLRAIRRFRDLLGEEFSER
jgi:RNA polymerase sigma-70 factor (ECF subfamily)